MAEKLNWIRYNKYNSLGEVQHREPKVDVEISKIVGKKIFINDPRLIKAIVELKRRKDPEREDNFLKTPSAIEAIKKALQ